MKSLADSIKGRVGYRNLEYFHEFLRGYTDVFTNKIYGMEDHTYHNLCGLIQSKQIVVVKGDRYSSIVTWKNYVICYV